MFNALLFKLNLEDNSFDLLFLYFLKKLLIFNIEKYKCFKLLIIIIFIVNLLIFI